MTPKLYDKRSVISTVPGGNSIELLRRATATGSLGVGLATGRPKWASTRSPDGAKLSATRR